MEPDFQRNLEARHRNVRKLLLTSIIVIHLKRKEKNNCDIWLYVNYLILYNFLNFHIDFYRMVLFVTKPLSEA